MEGAIKMMSLLRVEIVKLPANLVQANNKRLWPILSCKAICFSRSSVKSVPNPSANADESRIFHSMQMLSSHVFGHTYRHYIHTGTGT